jgi:hypothetical protein
MKKYLISMFLLSFAMVSAQVKPQMAKGSKIFVTTSSKNENAVNTVQHATNLLTEWNYWNIVEAEKDADLTLNLGVTASKGITLTSWGGTSYQMVGTILGKNKEVIWESNGYKASPNGTNGFNAGKSVAKKLVRDLKKLVGE